MKFEPTKYCSLSYGQEKVLTTGSGYKSFELSGFGSEIRRPKILTHPDPVPDLDPKFLGTDDL